MASIEDRVAALEDAVAQIAANAAGKSGHSSEVESAAVLLLGADEDEFDVEAEFGDIEPVEVEVADEASTEADAAAEAEAQADNESDQA
jgi:hypothetical protein